MVLTNDQLKALSFGYISGYDLLQWCPAQFLIKQNEVDSNCLQSGVASAISEIISNFETRYNLSEELAKTANIAPSAVAIITTGGISAINILVPGNNYTTAPDVVLTGGGGSGATATAIITGGKITSIVVTAAGTLYTTAPIVSFSGGQAIDTRSNLLVKIISLLAIRNILGNMQSTSEQLATNYKWAEKCVMDIRAGQMNIPVKIADLSVISVAYLVDDSFKTLG